MDHRFFVNFKIDDGIGDAVEVKKENVSKAEVEGLARAAGLVYHRRTTCGAYHQGRRAALVSHHAPACIFLRLDDIQSFALMIYRNKLRMIYTPSA